MKRLKEQVKGITLVALVVTIIMLLILSGIVIMLIIGDNNIFERSNRVAGEYNKQEATEKINLKITSAQMKVYAESQRMPTLQEVANDFCEDEEVQYVELESKKVASIKKIDIGEAKSIFTKLKNYDYEFEINDQLKLASINGVKIAETPVSVGNVLFDGQSSSGATLKLNDELTNYSYIEVYFRNLESKSASPMQKFVVDDIILYKRFSISENTPSWSYSEFYTYDENENTLTNTSSRSWGGSPYYNIDIYCLEVYRIVGIK